ncbi:MAG TPA: cupin domain-containing protein [Pyrinomonadaceae bacterium]|nr:cupin domain-containing protein [Pyrinomonadaceae bacterium]
MIVVKRESASVLHTPHGSEIRPLVDRTTAPVELCSLAEETLPVGAEVGRHFHRRTEEIYYVVAGVGLMTVAGETREVAAGDAVYIPRGAAHTLRNTGSAPMKILLVCGPAYSFEDHHAGEPE